MIWLNEYFTGSYCPGQTFIFLLHNSQRNMHAQIINIQVCTTHLKHFLLP